MKIKKYTVSNMQEAMNYIKNDLGPDAVIVSSEKAPRRSIKEFFGPRKLTVTAALEEHSDTVPAVEGTHSVNGDDSENRYSEYKGNGNKRVPSAAAVERTLPPRNTGGGLDITRPHSKKEPVISKDILPSKLPEPILQGKENQRDDWFKSMVKNMVEQGEGTAMTQVSDAGELLREMEVHEHIIENLLAGRNQGESADGEVNLEEFLHITLKNNIIKLVSNAYKKETNHRIMTFIGPTGVGKTVSLVKMATRYKVFYNKKIAMIALYDHRFGSLEELNYYAEIIGAPVEVVMTPGEMEKAIEKHEDKDYIFIDTEGRPSKNTAQILELKTFLDTIGSEQDIMLVLSATTKNRDIMRIARDFSRVVFSKVIFTKLDETDTLGSMLNIICEIGAPVSYVTAGQNIPDDIEAVNARRLAGLIVDRLDYDERVEF